MPPEVQAQFSIGLLTLLDIDSLAKLDTAEAAQGRGQTEVAVNLLEAFIQAVNAQAGKHILQPHADHLVMHAYAVIQSLDV